MINIHSATCICVTLLTVYNFMESQSEQLQVVGPKEPLVAVAGEDLVLPCFIKPNTSAVDMTVEWFKLYVEDSLVHLFRDHEDKNEAQAQSYRGRTSLFKEELQKGNASLKLSDLRVSDEGEYKCFVEDKSWYDDITVKVIVEAQGSHPVIMMESFDNSGGINLVCESRGWNPEPDVLWLDREGVTLTAEDTQIHRDTEGFSVKSRIAIYDYSNSNRFYCRLQQQHHMMETEIIINSEVFGVWKWAVSISVVTCLFLVGLILTLLFGYKKASERQQEKQHAVLLKKKMFREQLQVVGPEEHLVAVAGEDLVLPCFIKPNTSAVDMTVEWMRIEEVASLVHLYRDHEDRNEDQVQSYRDRTSLFKEELQKGNASLKLSALRLADEGEYKCLIEEKSWYDDITLHVIVEAQGSHPVIMMESFDNSGGINLVCESRGWKPEPDVLWLDREGVTLTAEDTQIHRDTEGFSVISRITIYDYSDSNRFYCRLQQQHHMIETEIIINSGVFGVWKWAVSITAVACVFLVGLILTLLFGYKKSSDLQQENHHLASDLQQEKQYVELLKKKTCRVDVTLDPDTAHPQLTVSADRKQVTHGDTRQNLADSPQRFKYPSVVGQQSFSTGRFYYEVQVSGKTEWTLGVVKENINRNEWIARNPQNGFWTIGLRNEYQCSAYDIPPVPFTLREKVEIVGVFVDYEEGLVSFYDVKPRSQIYSFTAQSFCLEKLYPYFSPRYKEDDRNSAPLIISDVTE